MEYHRLTILEIVYCNNSISINETVMERFLKQLEILHNSLICVSIVVCGDVNEPQRLCDFISAIKRLKVAISISFYGCKDFVLLDSIKTEVGQIRIKIETVNSDVVDLQRLFREYKTSSNNIVFLFEIDDINSIKEYVALLKSNDFIYNISYSSGISHNSYWILAKEVSELKKQYPMKVFQEFTCAGIRFDNIKGVCPARISLMCVDASGNIKYCYKDKYNHGLSIFDDEMNVLFEKLVKSFRPCTILLCNDLEYGNCLGGCPLDMKGSNNLYCKYYN